MSTMLNPYACSNPKDSLNANQFIGWKKSDAELWLKPAVKPFGYVYDEKFTLHNCNYDKLSGDPPEKLAAIREQLQKKGLLRNAIIIPAREATDDEIALVHTKEYITKLAALKTDADCEEFCKDKEMVILNPQSEKIARLAVGSCLELVKASVEGKIGNGFAIVRPQGNTAFEDQPAAFSLYNNVAIAAKYATTKLGLKRVAIVDLDIHAPYGTYHALRDRMYGATSKIFLFSLHSYHHGLIWPFTQDMDYDVREGNMMFFPLNSPMNTEGDYMGAFNHAILPCLREYKPELIILGAGFDSGYSDVMLDGGQAVKAHGFAHIARDLHEIAQDRVIAILEGGDHIGNVVESANMMVKGLQCKPFPRIHHPERLNGSMIETIYCALIHNKDRFRCIKVILEKLKQNQAKNGFPEFTLPSQRLFLSNGIRDMIEDIKAEKMCKTRDFAVLHRLSPEYAKIADTRIAAYKKEYVCKDNELVPEGYLLDQMIYDEKAKAEAYLRNASAVQILHTMFLDFKVGRSKNFILVDRESMVNNKKLKKYVIV